MLLRLEGDASGASKAIKKTESGFARLTSTIKGSALAQVASVAAVVVAIRSAVAAVGDWITAANAQEDAVKSLDSALASLGPSAAGLSKSLQEQAAALQKVSTAGDETIIKGQALIANFTKNEDEIKKATVAALDLSAAVGIDLNAAFLLMGKAAAGETSTLSRYGVILEEGIEKGDKFGAALELINTQFGGQAAAQAKTYSGLMKQISNAFGDLKETLGLAITKNKELLEVMTSLRDVYTTGGLVDGIVSFAGGIAGAVTDTVNFARGAAEAATNLKDWAKEQVVLNAAITVAEAKHQLEYAILSKIYDLYSLIPRAMTAYGEAINQQARAEALAAEAKQELIDKQNGVNTALTDSASLADKWAASVAAAAKAEEDAIIAAKDHAAALYDQANAYQDAITKAGAFGEVTSVQLSDQIGKITLDLILQKQALGEGSLEYENYARIGGDAIEVLEKRIKSLQSGMGDLKEETKKATPAVTELAESFTTAETQGEVLAASMLKIKGVLVEVSNAAGFTTTQFDALAASAGRAAAVQAAIAGGGTLVNSGTRVRVRGGSRLTSSPSTIGGWTQISGSGTFSVPNNTVQTLPNGRLVD